MSLTEQTVLAAVTLNLVAGTIEVCRVNTIKRGNDTISEIPHRKAYSLDQKGELLAEVEGGQKYADLLGW